MTAANPHRLNGDQPALSRFVILILPKLILVVIEAVITFPLWPFFGLGMMIWAHPPNIPYLAQVKRYLRDTWTVSPVNPGLPVFARIWISLAILQKIILIPVPGLAWFLDELLYGSDLDNITITEPLFVISAARSGSTQITRYLEDDPRLAAPNILQTMFPYLWLWKLGPKTLGRLLSKDRVRNIFQRIMPPELWERHEADPFRADTFDGSFYSFHLNRFSFSLGPEIARQDFNMAGIAPHDQHLKEVVFINIVDRIARKTLHNAGPLPDGSKRRFLLKGHFLYGAASLSEKYPDACFLTVIREPLARLQSGINYLRVNPADPVLGPTPWAWLKETLVFTEAHYCEVEKEWFSREDAIRRCVIRFKDFVNDLEAAMKQVYGSCFNSEDLPPHIPGEHPPRDRRNYSVNYSLAELGIDEKALQVRLGDYIDWCQSSRIG